MTIVNYDTPSFFISSLPYCIFGDKYPKKRKYLRSPSQVLALAVESTFIGTCKYFHFLGFFLRVHWEGVASCPPISNEGLIKITAFREYHANNGRARCHALPVHSCPKTRKMKV